MDKETLQTIASSDIWEKLKEIIFEQINDIKDVTVPLEVRGVLVKPGDAYLAKALAATKLLDFVHYIDIHKSSKSVKTDPKDLFI